jgi:hypothetical protein
MDSDEEEDETSTTTDDSTSYNLYTNSSDQSIDWDDLTDVIQPIPAYMESVLAEMRTRYTRSDLRFHGDAACLRWRMDEDELQTCFNAPDEHDAADNPFYTGRHWMSYEGGGSYLRNHSPAWSLFVEVGVVKAEIATGGMRFLVQLKSFPAEPFWETLYDQVHLVASMDEWVIFKRDILDGVAAQLIQRVESDVAMGFSGDSTEPYSEGDDAMSDDGDM